MKKQANYNQLKEKYRTVLQDFETYLKKQDYASDTIRIYLNYTSWFLQWLEKEQLTVDMVVYNDILSFISYCRESKDTTNLINRKLGAVRKYYEYLQFKEKVTGNPAAGLYLKGKKRTVPGDLLDKEALENLYESYTVYDLRTKRNKVILSLLIHQALTTEELTKLEPLHIKLRSGKIEIPGSRHSNGRTLKLESHQILELHEYLNETRPSILKAIKENPLWPGRKARIPDFKLLETRLFISMNGGSSLKNSLLHLTNNLKQVNPKVKNIRQIRQSVITEWLKVKDTRVVQYMAGHRYVSSTERYLVNNLEDLEEALKEHHPLK